MSPELKHMSIPDAHVLGVDVPVPRRQAGDALPQQLLLHVADDVMGRELFLDHVPSEQGSHLVRHGHPRVLVGVALVDGVIGPEGVVFGVPSALPVPRVLGGHASCALVVFVPTGLGPEPVPCRELPDRDPAAGPGEPVPVGGERLPLFERQERSRHVLCDILSPHGVLSLMVHGCGGPYHTRDCDALVAFVRDAPCLVQF